MARRVLLLAAASLLAHAAAARDADCLGDGASCALSLGCPQICCTGVASRTTSGIMHCPSFSAVMRDTTPTLTPSPSSAEGSGAWEPAPSSSSNGSTSPEEATPAPVTNDNTTATATAPTTPTTPAPTTPPTPVSTQKSDSVSAFQSSSGLAGSRGSAGSAAIVVVGALAGCVVLVAAVMYKRKTAAKQDLEIPGSSYHGGGKGLTPDNRTLDSIVDARGSNDSMKQLPVLSVTQRDVPAATRPSSPFGHGVARISSPAQRGLTNEDYAFEVENGARPGSSVQVAFVDASADSAGLVPEKNGVVAL